MKTRVLFKSTAVLMTVLLMCACVKEEMTDYNPEQSVGERVTVIAGIGEDADTKITLGEDLGSTTEVLWSPEDSIALTDGQKLYVFNRSDDSDVATERAEFTYNGKAGSLPATGTEDLKFVYPVSAPEKYSQQPGSIDGVSDFMQMEALIPESTASLEGLQLTFSHSTAVIKLELTSDAFFNQEASVIFSYSNRSTRKECEIRTEKLKADAQGVVTAYIVHPAASIENIRIYVKTSSGLHETSLSSKQIMPGKLYKVKKNDFAQSNELLEGMLPEGEVFNEIVRRSISNAISTLIGLSGYDEEYIESFEVMLSLVSGCGHSHNEHRGDSYYHGDNGQASLDICDDWGCGLLRTAGSFFGENHFGYVGVSICTISSEFEFHPNSSWMFSFPVDDIDSFPVDYIDIDIDFGQCNTSNVIDMSHMFSGCEYLRSLDLSSFDTSNVTDMSGMFSGCEHLGSLDLSGFDTSNVTDMSGMFSGCRNIESLDLSNFDFSKVESFSRMFEDCGSSASNRPIPIIVTQEGYDILKDKDTGINPSYASFCISNPKAGFLANGAVFNSALRQFRSQNSLRKIKFIAGSKATGTPILGSDAVMVANGDCLEIHTSASEFVFNEHCSSMFSNLDYVTEIDFNDCINTSSATDMSHMFHGCDALTSLDLSSFDTSNVTDMSYMFYYCSSLTSLDLSSFDTSNVTDMSGMFRMISDIYSGIVESDLTSLDLSSFDTSNVTDMSDMFYHCSSLTSLDLSSFDTSNVTDMSDMFYNCSSLTSLDLSSFDTSNVTSMSNMFQNCYDLTTLDLSSFDTSNVTDMSSMFNNCSSFTSLDLSSFDTSNVTDMSDMFYHCSSLTSLDLSSFDTSNVTDMSGMFLMRSNIYSGSESDLTSLDLSSFDTSNVTDMSDMFYYCSSLTSLDLSSFDTSNVTSMSNMFQNCYDLTTLDLSSFDTSNVTDMSGMFSACRSLTSLDLSSFDTSNVTDMSGMFSGCRSLTSLDLSSFDTSNVTDMSDMFYYCSSLTSLDLSSFDTSNVTSVSNMFQNCRSLTSLDLSSFDFSKVGSSTWNMFKECGLHTSYSRMPIIVTQEGYDILKDRDTGINSSDAYFYIFNPKEGIVVKGDIFNGILHQFLSQNSLIKIKFIAGSQAIGTPILCSDAVMVANGDCLEIHTPAPEFVFNEHCSSMFSNLGYVTEIDFNDCINTSNVTDMSAMFSSCLSLTSLDLSSFDTSNVTSMSIMFQNCRSLTSLDLSSFDTSNVTSMSNMFYDCRSLTSLDLSSFDTSNVTDMSGMFGLCRSLTSLDLSSFDTSNVTDMSVMFEYCYDLTSLDLSSFDTSNVTSMSIMFQNCRSLTSLDLSSFDTSNVTDMSAMFSSCLSLTSLDLSSFDTSNVTSMSNMFYDCRSLTSLDLSSFDTSNVTSMSIMFQNCYNLTSLDLSSFDTSNVTDMSGMFEFCNDLTSLDLSSFDFNKVKSFSSMFEFLGSMAPNKPISISVTQAGYDILNAQSTGIIDSYAKLVVVP